MHSVDSVSMPSAPPVSNGRRRFSQHGLLARSPRFVAVHATVAAGAYALTAAAAVAVNHHLLWVVAWVTMSLLLLGAGACIHESVHGHVLPGRWNRVSGLIAGILLLIPFSSYRWYHLAHHVDAATDRDPEGDLTVRSRLTYLLVPLGGVLFAATLWSHVIRGAFRRAPHWVSDGRQRRDLLVDGAVSALVIIAGVVASTRTALVWQLWFVPAALMLMVWLPFFTLPEHHGGFGTGTTAAESLSFSVTVESNALVRFLFWNNNFHAVHHLAPRVPGAHLRRADALVAAEQPSEWRHRSYWHWHYKLLRSLPWKA